MKTAQVLFVVLASCVCVSYCKDLIVGTSFNNRLIWQEKAEYNAIPLKKRVKEVFYSDPGQQIIKGVIARDLDHTDAIATITAGGLVNLTPTSDSRVNEALDSTIKLSCTSNTSQQDLPSVQWL